MTAPRSGTAAAEVASLQDIASTIAGLRGRHQRALDDLLAQRARLAVRAIQAGLPVRAVAGHLRCTPATVAKIVASR